MIVIRTDQRGKLNYNSQLNKNNCSKVYMYYMYINSRYIQQKKLQKFQISFNFKLAYFI